MPTESKVSADRVVLLVDLEPPYSYALAARCVGAGFRALPITGELPSSALAQRVALCVVGLRSRDSANIDRVQSLTKSLPTRSIVVLANGIGLQQAIEVNRLGVAELIELPAEPREVASRVFEHVTDPESDSEEDLDFVGTSPEMARVRARIAAASRVSSTVLIQGETGTGKGVIARRIHTTSERAARPFVHVDCGALAPNLIESELFGHERGAFTGAATFRRGRFETAGDGTIFLDEIGELPLHLQAKLLRVLEDREFERVGGNVTIRLHARVLAATNRPLQEIVRSGAFRSDLFFRLNVLSIEVPPLRERRSDVPLLVQAGLRRIAAQHGIPVPRVSESACQLLAAERWRGNVRELLNLLERLAIEHPCTLTSDCDLEDYLRATRGVAEDVLDVCELGRPADAERIAKALRATGGNLSRTARRLELPRSTLRHRIHKYQLEDLVPRD